MSFALVSTIIPTFNRAEMLREAVGSVVAQTYRPIEIIVVDDGSTDDTPKVANAMQRQHPEITRVIRQNNAGAGAARQLGFESSHGEFIQFLDSDDLLMPRKFELQVASLHSDIEAGISYGLTRAHDLLSGETKVTHGTHRKHREIFPAVLEARLWHTVTPLYRRSVCNAIGSWSNLRIFEDWDYDCRAGLLGTKLQYVDELIAVIRHHGGDRAGLAWQRDATAMHDRIMAYAKILDYAVRAGVSRESREMGVFVRSLFWMAREAGRCGFADESEKLFQLAHQNAVAPGWDYRLYGMAGRLLGWEEAGWLAGNVSTWKKKKS